MRIRLVKLDENRHRLLLSTHHIVCDGWSFFVFLEDLAAFYNARKNNTAHQAPAAFQFSQYAKEEAIAKESVQAEVDLAYWVAQFATVPEPLDLPIDGPRPRLRTFASKRIDWTIDDALTAALKQLARKQGATLTAIMLAAVSAYLHRICRQSDIVIGVPAAGQAASGHSHLIGHCVNLLPLRFSVSGEASFGEHVVQCRKLLLDGYEHQRITYGTLVRKLKLPRDPGRSPLVSVIFNIDQGMDEVCFDELVISVSTPPRVSENFELFFNLVQDKSGLTIECQYNTALFDREQLAMHLSGLQELLAAVSLAPEQRVNQLPVISSAERQLQLDEFNNTYLELPDVESFIDLFRDAAQRYGEKTAVVFRDSSLSYAELDRQSDMLAAHILSSGAGGRGTLIGIYLQRSLNMLVATLGVLKSGAGYVPLDPDFPKDRLQYMIEDSRLSILITEKGLPVDDFKHAAAILDIDADAVRDESLDAASVRQAAPCGEDIGYVIYTSGSTGKPKGVAVPHSAILNFLVSMREVPGMGEQDRLLAVTTLSFDIAVLELYLPLICGATVYLAAKEDTIDGARLAGLIEANSISIFQATPSTWRLLLAAGWEGGPGLKGLIGGEALPRTLAEELVRRIAELWNMYGPTETTVWSTVYRVPKEEATILVGTPIGNTQLYVLDGFQQLLPRGVPGELYIGGKGVTRGYLHREDLTTKAFIANPLFPDREDIIYRTGDLVRYRMDGNVEYLNRLDNQVKLRGYRIELGEIETAICKVAGIQEAVVTIFALTEEDQRLVAYLKKDDGIDLNAVRTGLRATLPPYMLPQHYMLLDAFPLTANGKIDRKNLPRPIREDASRSETEMPRDDFERSLLAVWRRVLKTDDFGITDNFFEMGGHSLLALTLVNEMKKATGVEIAYGSIFTTPTIKELVDSLGFIASKKASSIVALQPEGDKTPFFCLCGINLYRELAEMLGQDQPVYAVYADEEQAVLRKAVQGQVAEVSVEKLAGIYSKAIRRQQSVGPYRLAGISFGGILALETAKILQSEGDTVQLVVLLDTILRQGEKRRQLGALKHYMRKTTEGGVDYLFSKARKKLADFIDHRPTAERGSLLDEESAIRFRELAYLQAQDEYEEKIKPYSGDVLLFRAEGHLDDAIVEYLPDYGWSRHLRGDFNVFDVPGNHLDIIQQPYVQKLVEILRRFL